MPKPLHSFLIAWMIFSFQLTYGQGQPEEKIALSSILEKVLNSRNDVYIQNKIIFVENKELNHQTGIFDYYSMKYPDLLDSISGRLKVRGGLIFNNCVFLDELSFYKMDFKKKIMISKSKMKGLSIHDSEAHKIRISRNKGLKSIDLFKLECARLDISFNAVKSKIEINHCVVSKNLNIDMNAIGKGELKIINSQILEASVEIGNNSGLAEVIEGCTIQLKNNGAFRHYKTLKKEPVNLYLTNNTFKGDSTTQVIFDQSDYLNLRIENNVFEQKVYFVENMASERFFLFGNEFKKTISFDKFLFSEIWNELYWDQFSGNKLRYKEYGALSDSDFAEARKFANLIKIYKELHNIFSARGDLISANECYSEMKELQGRMHKYIFDQDKTFDNFFRWQLNVLLKLYTNHGTDPGLAVVMSFYVIMIFSLLYLFFPSEWDKGKNHKLKESYERLTFKNKSGAVNAILSILFMLIVILINSITLSINSFVTLGFGSIPTNGFARYLCIIEGFIGWFLLSIFSVSLINQVLA